MEKKIDLKELSQRFYEVVADAIEQYDDLDGMVLEVSPATYEASVVVSEDADDDKNDCYSFMELVKFDSEGRIFPDRDTLTEIAGEYI